MCTHGGSGVGTQAGRALWALRVGVRKLGNAVYLPTLTHADTSQKLLALEVDTINFKLPLA